MATQEKDPATLVEIMQQGQATQFWAELVSITQENIKMIDTQIITKTSLEPGHEGEELSEIDCDKLRDKRGAMEDLINLPSSIVKSNTRENTDDEEMDPYAKTSAELREPVKTDTDP